MSLSQPNWQNLRPRQLKNTPRCFVSIMRRVLSDYEPSLRRAQMGKIRDLSERVFHRWTVLAPAGLDKHRKQLWTCRCQCGVVREVLSNNLTRGVSKSCGCWNMEVLHSRPNTALLPEYKIWSSMRSRCNCETDTNFKNYGARGIKVCEQWDSFQKFYADMGPRPPGLSIERVDNNGDYTPKNCEWATKGAQARNKRNSRLYTLEGVTKTQTEWANLIGVTPANLAYRLKAGWTLKEACTIPNQGHTRVCLNLEKDKPCQILKSSPKPI